MNQDDNMTKSIISMLKTIFIYLIIIGVFKIIFIVPKIINPKVENINNVLEQTTSDIENLKRSAFIVGFYLGNTQVLEEYCKPTDYIPYLYIKDFKLNFSDENEKAEELLKKYLKNDYSTLYDTIISSPHKFDAFDKEYQELNKEVSLSKKEYCQVFDDYKDTIISEKRNFLNNKNAINSYIQKIKIDIN